MKVLFLCLTLLTTQAFAQRMSKIDADFRCGTEGGEIAVKVLATSAKIWQTDPGEEEGIQLKVKEFTRLRCPGCYTFTAILMGQIQVRGQIASSKLTYEAYNEEAGQWEELYRNAQCKNTKR